MRTAAQILPLTAMVICLVAYQFKRKYHILILSAFANALNALAYFLLGNAGSAMMIALASTLQCGFEAYKSYAGKKTSTPQKILYFFLFFALGLIEFKTPVDILPIAAAMMFVWSNFCQSEQKMRLCLMGNAILWIIYNSVIGSTALISHIFSLVSLIMAFMRYRFRNSEHNM